MSVLTTRLDFLSDVLQDFCTLHKLEFLSADDLLYDPSNQLTDYQRDWLILYCSTWDIITNNEDSNTPLSLYYQFFNIEK
mgnify:CR=1 FL=1